jgi:hypothetical protein
MYKTSLPSLLLLAAIASLTPAAAQNSRSISSGTADNGQFVFTYKLNVEQVGNAPLPRLGGGSLTKANTMQRFLLDDENKRYTGYDLRVEALSSTSCKVTLAPLSATAEELRLPGTGWTSFTLPTLPPSHVLNQGDTLALDLMIHPRTGQRIVEYITVNPKSARTLQASNAPARDFRLEDIPLQLFDPQIKVNGRLESNPANRGGGVSGTVLWIQLPHRGRYVLSLVPHATLGFRKSGEIRGNKLSFQWNGDTFEVETNTRIAPAAGAWNLYVYHNPATRSHEEAIGAGDAEFCVKMN